MNLDGTEKQETLSLDTLTLNGAYKGWLYYYNGMEGAGLFRVRLDGSERERLIGPGDFVWVHFLDDQIIFYDNNRERYRMMDLDGGNVRNLPK